MGSYARKGEMAYLSDSAIPCMFSWKETPLISTARIEHTVVPLMIFSVSQDHVPRSIANRMQEKAVKRTLYF